MGDAAPPLAASGWSSSLSVAEHTAVREAGFEPRGLVMGSSVYTIGISYSPGDYAAAAYGQGPFAGGMYGGWGAGVSRSFPGWYKYYSAADLGLSGGWGGGGGGSLGGYGYVRPAAMCWERRVFEDGIESAARNAMDRLLAETHALGAHGVVGTRLNFHYLEGFTSTIEFTAIGTAVARPGAAPLRRPFTSHLGGQDLLKLLRAGMVPVSVSVGAGSVVAEMGMMMGLPTMELVPFGEAVEASRRIASERLSAGGHAGGWAVLGTLASTSMAGEGAGQVMTTVLTGTVVRRFATGSWERLPLPIMRLSRP